MGNFNLDNYVPVNERITMFYSDCPNGRITTEMVIHSEDSGLVIFKASVFRATEDAEPSATGHAYERAGEGYINKTSHIENCETSAVGRALALLGYEITRGIASREEMQKVERMTPKAAAAAVGSRNDPQAPRHFDNSKPETGKAFSEKGLASNAQLTLYIAKAEAKGVDPDNFAAQEFSDVEKVGELSKPAISYLIDQLK